MHQLFSRTNAIVVVLQITSIWTFLTGCDSVNSLERLNSKTSSDSRTSSNATSSQSANNTTALALTGINPIAGVAGTKVLIRGSGLDTAIFQINNTTIKAQTSEGQAILTIPEESPGFLDISITNNLSSIKHVFYQLPLSSDNPIYDSDESNICAGTTYYLMLPRNLRANLPKADLS